MRNKLDDLFSKVGLFLDNCFVFLRVPQTRDDRVAFGKRVLALEERVLVGIESHVLQIDVYVTRQIGFLQLG